MLFRRKPVEIEAVQWTGNMQPIIDLMGFDLPPFNGCALDGDQSLLFPNVLKKNGEKLDLFDWIVKLETGFVRYSHEDFSAMYEKAPDQPF